MPRVGMAANHTAIGVDDAVAHGKPEPGPLADRLGGEKRLKQLPLVLRRHAGSVVLDFEPYLPPVFVQAEQNAASLASPRLDRLLRIDDEIERDLLELGDVRVDLPGS